MLVAQSALTVRTIDLAAEDIRRAAVNQSPRGRPRYRTDFAPTTPTVGVVSPRKRASTCRILVKSECVGKNCRPISEGNRERLLPVHQPALPEARLSSSRCFLTSLTLFPTHRGKFSRLKKRPDAIECRAEL